MGAYLTQPVTEKFSSDEVNNSLKCGVSSMQGWRVSQEDAHNCILDLSENLSLMAVYDGHGGKEVAEYAAKKLPDFIKDSDNFKKGDYIEALKEAFLKFDKSLTEPDVIDILKELAEKNDEGDATEDEDENLGDLKEEAEMPLEAVIAKYASGKLMDQKGMKWKRENLSTPVSPFLRAKMNKPLNEAECTSSSLSSDFADEGSSDSGAAACSSSSSCSGVTRVAEPAVSSSSSSKEITRTSLAEKYLNGDATAPDSSGDVGEESVTEEVVVNGNGVEDDGKQNAEISSSENGPAQSEKSKGKGKALLKHVPLPAKKKESVNPDELFKKFVSSDPAEDSSESDSDENFTGQDVVSSSDDEGRLECHSLTEGCSSKKPDSGGLEEDDECEDEEDEDEDDDEDEEGMEDDDDEFTMGTTDEPGSDSGCTAVVALVAGDKVYVANAGDSRCVASQNGVAVDLSLDHKPEDEVEMQRIKNAGGKVTSEGRVNGGLNLSRALGDHVYKLVTELPAEEQMISPMPDVKVLEVTPDVEFLVLACDGIWNFMSSQEVVDFVRPRLLKNPEKLSSVCEELFDTCLAPDTAGDGTGCDNMTAVIVQFRGAKLEPIVKAVKRKSEEDVVKAAQETEPSKRSKTETVADGPESTMETPSCSVDAPEP